MYYIGCLCLSGYNIVSLRWPPGVSFAVPPLTFAISAAQCRFWQRIGCCVLLRSAARGELLIPRAHLAIMQRRAFSVVGPSAWNDLPVELRSEANDLPFEILHFHQVLLLWP